jgi:phosphodiesterase/alkaline phosphatase D-like protein
LIADGKWADRKANAIQAYHEWMPIRSFDVASGKFIGGNLARTFQFGSLATLFMAEGRTVGGCLQHRFVAMAAWVRQHNAWHHFTVQAAWKPSALS